MARMRNALSEILCFSAGKIREPGGPPPRRRSRGETGPERAPVSRSSRADSRDFRFPVRQIAAPPADDRVVDSRDRPDF